jgi:hypothetical protein
MFEMFLNIEGLVCMNSTGTKWDSESLVVYWGVPIQRRYQHVQRSLQTTEEHVFHNFMHILNMLVKDFGRNTSVYQLAVNFSIAFSGVHAYHAFKVEEYCTWTLSSW